MKQVVLVNDKNEVTGAMGKIEAHEKGLLHRAFSVLIFDKQGNWLIHRRAEIKYHSPGLWTNACCGHPEPAEELSLAAGKRLKEEMGFDCTLKPFFFFKYKAQFDNGLIENEMDQTFRGIYEGELNPNPDEVSEWKYISTAELGNEIFQYPENFTVWFKIIFEKVIKEKLLG